MPDVSSRRNLFFATDTEWAGENGDEFARVVKTSPTPKRCGSMDDYLKDDDDYEWKSICWIDSKVRADVGFSCIVLRGKIAC
jgi:hypothetical protein